MKSLREKYLKDVVPKMMGEFHYSSVMAVPKVERVSVNVGVGRQRDEKILGAIRQSLALITGQKLISRPAKIAIAAFKTRKGQIVGYTATLRGKRMYDFLDRLIHIALPRQRDFQGLSEESFDERGNLTIGIKEHMVFPEVGGEDVRTIFGFEVTIVVRARSRKESIALFRHLGFPIKSKS